MCVFSSWFSTELWVFVNNLIQDRSFFIFPTDVKLLVLTLIGAAGVQAFAFPAQF